MQFQQEQQAYNTAAGGRETLNNLFEAIKNGLEEKVPNIQTLKCKYRIAWI